MAGVREEVRWRCYRKGFVRFGQSAKKTLLKTITHLVLIDVKSVVLYRKKKIKKGHMNNVKGPQKDTQNTDPSCKIAMATEYLTLAYTIGNKTQTVWVGQRNFKMLNSLEEHEILKKQQTCFQLKGNFMNWSMSPNGCEEHQWERRTVFQLVCEPVTHTSKTMPG